MSVIRVVRTFFIGCIPVFLVLILQFGFRSHTPETELLVENDVPLEADSLVSTYTPTLLYGVNVDSMVVVEGRIKRNQVLSDILIPFNISYQQMDVLAKRSREVFDVRKLVTGKPYTIIHGEDSLSTAKYFIYQPNAVEYVVYELSDSIQVYKREKPIQKIEKHISGVIKTSLYEDMVARGASPQLVNELADVFGWQIDFFKIQEGDQYKLIYEETSVDGEVVAMGNIRGAYFNHFNNPFYAIFFDQGEGEDYFDEKGESLRKAFLRAPVEYSRISSRYSGRRFHPVQKRWKAHLGTDYAAPRGTPIRATADGIVTEARFKKYNGNFVKIKHNSTYSTQYLHMVNIARGIKPGVRVRQGQTIGYVGSTGLATGNHVCYRFWKNGQQVDALKVYIPPSEPIREENREEFELVKSSVIAELDSIMIIREEGMVAVNP